MNRDFHVKLTDGFVSPPVPPNLAAAMAQRGALEIEFYMPRGEDTQNPHSRDEIYVIARGAGVLEVEENRYAFSPGDVLFVAARARHRFVDFSDDFATWVMFYGPEGGER
jgi:mannose-6-phosphate isomerase-like protein (cupin superfamily)